MIDHMPVLVKSAHEVDGKVPFIDILYLDHNAKVDDKNLLSAVCSGIAVHIESANKGENTIDI